MAVLRVLVLVSVPGLGVSTTLIHSPGLWHWEVSGTLSSPSSLIHSLRTWRFRYVPYGMRSSAVLRPPLGQYQSFLLCVQIVYERGLEWSDRRDESQVIWEHDSIMYLSDLTILRLFHLLCSTKPELYKALGAVGGNTCTRTMESSVAVKHALIVLCDVSPNVG